MTKHRGPARVAADFLLNLIACNLGPKLKTTPGSESLTQWSASARGPFETCRGGLTMSVVRGRPEIAFRGRQGPTAIIGRVKILQRSDVLPGVMCYGPVGIGSGRSAGFF